MFYLSYLLEEHRLEACENAKNALLYEKLVSPVGFAREPVQAQASRSDCWHGELLEVTVTIDQDLEGLEHE